LNRTWRKSRAKLTVQGLDPTVQSFDPTVQGLDPTVQSLDPTIQTNLLQAIDFL
jgi:hypothetical protein